MFLYKFVSITSVAGELLYKITQNKMIFSRVISTISMHKPLLIGHYHQDHLANCNIKHHNDYKSAIKISFKISSSDRSSNLTVSYWNKIKRGENYQLLLSRIGRDIAATVAASYCSSIQLLFNKSKTLQHFSPLEARVTRWWCLWILFSNKI